MTPANVTSMGMGAALYASGSQLWKGNSGVLMAKASAKTKKRPNWSEGEGASVASCDRSKVFWPVTMYSPMMPTSISSEPANVYRTNFSAAEPARGPSPYSQSKKYAGMSMASQKT